MTLLDVSLTRRRIQQTGIERFHAKGTRSRGRTLKDTVFAD